MSELWHGLSYLTHGDHACPIYESDSERVAVVAAFIHDGLARNERCLCCARNGTANEVVYALREAGERVEQQLERGALRFLEHGCSAVGFDELPRLLAFLDQAEQDALNLGFNGLRYIGGLSWSLPGGENDILKNEVEINRFLTGRQVVILCPYDLRHLDAAVQHDVIRTHPTVILGTDVHPNPYYEPPELLLWPHSDQTADFKRKRVEWWISRLEAVRELEQQLRQAQKMEAIGRLAGGIAHDFNNLLLAMGGHAHFVLEELKPEDPARDDILEIVRGVERATTLTRQLLAFSRKQVLKPERVSLTATVLETQKLLGRLIGAHIDLTVTADPNVCEVIVDPGQIDQIVVNLAVNARDAMPGGGRLTVSVARLDLGPDAARAAGMPPGAYARLSVADTGEGMDEATRAKIFEPFFTTKPAGHGTGLGLATVYGIVKQSRGYIEVESKPHVGTRFDIYFPCAE